jgi:hypothetical protein
VVEDNTEVVVDELVVSVVELPLDLPHPASKMPAKANTAVVTRKLLPPVIGVPFSSS